MKKYIKYIIGALLIVGVLGSAAVAYAAQGVDFEGRRGGPGGPGVGGEVIAVDGNTIKVENPRGEGVIVTNDETEFIVNGEAGSLSDVVVGKFAMAMGEKQGDGSVSAGKVMVVDELPERGSRPDGGEGMPGRPDKGPRVGGEVTSVNANTINVENPRGEGTIVTNDETEFIVDGEAGSLADVVVGKFVGAGGEMQDDGSILADRVMIHDDAPPPPGHPGKGPRVGGEVTSVDGNTIKVENPRGAGTIATNDETEFIVNGEAGSLADVTVGKFVGAGGERQDDGSILADRVMVMDELPERGNGEGMPDHPGRGPRVGGEVTSVDGNTINVENPRGAGTIVTNDETKFIVNGEAGSLADVAVGKFVGAGGETQDDGSILADRVMVMDELPEHGAGPKGGQNFGGQRSNFETY